MHFTKNKVKYKIRIIFSEIILTYQNPFRRSHRPLRHIDGTGAVHSTRSVFGCATGIINVIGQQQPKLPEQLLVSWCKNYDSYGWAIQLYCDVGY